MKALITLLEGIVSLGTLGLMMAFMCAFAILPILIVVWLLQLIF